MYVALHAVLCSWVVLHQTFRERGIDQYDYVVLCAFSLPRSSRHIAKDPDADEGSADNAGGESSIPQVCCV